MLVSPTFTASAMVILWVPFACVVYLLRPAERAAALVYLLGVLYLPPLVYFMFPLMPQLDKTALASLGMLFGAVLFGRRLLAGVSLDGVSKFFIGVTLLANVLRVLTNTDPLYYGSLVVPGLVPRNVIAFTVYDLLLVVVPFYFGVALGTTAEGRTALFRTWLTCGVFYACLATVELRLSPQMNRWIYGYHQHSWTQAVREGGYRPLLFMHHGLELALFNAGTALIATVAGRLKQKVYGVSASLASYVVLAILVLSNSMAALFYAVLGKVLLHLASPKRRLTAAAIVTAIVLLNPLSRTLDWLPTEAIVETIAAFSPERASSLQFRFSNEDLLLEKARERWFTGWGGFGRIRVYDDYGTDLTTVDGAWIIAFAGGGAPRFLGMFGLLCWPIVLAWRKAKQITDRDALGMISSLALLASFFAFDLLPNGMFNQLPYLLSGFVLGCTRAELKPQAAAPRSLAPMR